MVQRDRGIYSVARGGGAPLKIVLLSAKGAVARGRMVQASSAPVALTVLAVQSNAYVCGIAGITGKAALGVFVLLVPANPNACRDVWLPNQIDSKL